MVSKNDPAMSGNQRIFLPESQTGVPGTICLVPGQGHAPHITYIHSKDGHETEIRLIPLVPLSTIPTPVNVWVFKNHEALLRYWDAAATMCQWEINAFVESLSSLCSGCTDERPVGRLHGSAGD